MAPVSVTSLHSQILWLDSQNTLRPFLPVDHVVHSQGKPIYGKPEAESMVGKADHSSSFVGCVIVLSEQPLVLIMFFNI